MSLAAAHLELELALEWEPEPELLQLALALEPSRAVRAAIRHYCLIMALYCRLKDVQVPAVGVMLAGSLTDSLPGHAMLNSL